MSAEVKEETFAAVNGSEEPQGSEDHEAGDQPRVRKKRTLGVDPSLIISDGRSKRRKTPTPQPETDVKKEQGGVDRDPKDPERAASLGSEIYKKVVDMKDKEYVLVYQARVTQLLVDGQLIMQWRGDGSTVHEAAK